MESISQAFWRASEQSRFPTVAELGGVDALMSVSESIRDSLIGDFVDALLSEWGVLHDKASAAAAILLALSRCNDRLSYAHALESIVTFGRAVSYRDLAKSLDARVRDDKVSIIQRMDALSYLIRIALIDQEARPLAVASLSYLEDVDDTLAIDMWCRLASLSYQQLSVPEALVLLERKAKDVTATGQAHLEIGLIRLGEAFEKSEVAGIGIGLEGAIECFSKAEQVEHSQTIAAAYGLLTKALRAIASENVIQSDISAAFREAATMSALWNVPAPGSEWLHPGREILLEWAPLISKMQFISEKMGQPSWLNAADVLSKFVEVYAYSRAVRPGGRGVEELLRPVIEATFIRERGLLAHLIEWLDQSDGPLAPQDAQALRRNIEQRLSESPPGNMAGMVTKIGRPPSSMN